MLTIKDLKKYAKRQARLDTSNYMGAPDALKADRNAIKRARNAAIKAAGFRWYYDDYDLVPGSYSNGRLDINKSEVDYTAGQYSPTEIWWAVENYFNTLKLRGE